MNAKHSMIVNLVNTTLNEEGSEEFCEELIKMFERRADANWWKVQASMQRAGAPLLETQRSIGAVHVLLEVAGKVKRIAQRYLENGDQTLGDAFTQLGARLMSMAERRATPVVAVAQANRAERAKGSN